MPTVIQGVLIIGGSVVFALLVHALVSRLVPLQVLEEHNEVAGVMMALVGGMYGVLLAFVVVLAWERWNEAREDAAAEANAIADFAHTVVALPEPASGRLRAGARTYLEALEGSEWDDMARGRDHPRASELSAGLWRELTAFAPTNDRERNLHLTGLQHLARVSDSRRARLILSTQGIPPALWAVLVSGGIITIGLGNFLGLRYRRSKAVMLAAFACMIALVLFVIVSLDHPYRGASRITPDDLELVRHLLREGG